MIEPDPSVELMRMINWYQVSQALHVAATLGVADQLKDEQKSYNIVARACGAHPPSLSIRCLLDHRCAKLSAQLRPMDRNTRPVGFLGQSASQHQIRRKCIRVYAREGCLDL